jgi:hypothetical protein
MSKIILKMCGVEETLENKYSLTEAKENQE